MRRRVFNSKTAKHSHSGLKCGVVAMCIGGVEVQDQLPRRLRKRSDELLDQHLMHGPGYLTLGVRMRSVARIFVPNFPTTGTRVDFLIVLELRQAVVFYMKHKHH
jgi:hypothetical protein